MSTRLLHDKDAAVDRMGSMDLYVEIARAFAEALPETEAAIAEAMDKKAWAESRRLVHSLKSNCAAMGAERLREEVFSLEKACADGDEHAAVPLFASVRDNLRLLRDELLSL